MTTPNGEMPDELSKLEKGYELLGELSRDEMVTVYVARDRLSGNEVTIKVLRAGDARGREALAHYASDARLLTALEHPNIVAVHGVKWLSENVVAVITERVKGPTLRQVLDVAGTLPVARATEVLKGLARALAWAHSSQIMHRDVRPENVIFEDGTGRVVLSDFGLARRLEAGPGDPGADAYRAPELADGRYPDQRTDVYSLGVVGWELLTGRRPWPDGMDLIRPGQPIPAPPPLAAIRPGLPPALVSAIEGAVELDRDRRMTDVVAFLDRLTGITPPPRPKPKNEDEDTFVVEPGEWVALPVPNLPTPAAPGGTSAPPPGALDRPESSDERTRGSALEEDRASAPTVGGDTVADRGGEEDREIERPVAREVASQPPSRASASPPASSAESGTPSTTESRPEREVQLAPGRDVESSAPAPAPAPRVAERPPIGLSEAAAIGSAAAAGASPGLGASGDAKRRKGKKQEPAPDVASPPATEPEARPDARVRPPWGPATVQPTGEASAATSTGDAAERAEPRTPPRPGTAPGAAERVPEASSSAPTPDRAARVGTARHEPGSRPQPLVGAGGRDAGVTRGEAPRVGPRGAQEPREQTLREPVPRERPSGDTSARAGAPAGEPATGGATSNPPFAKPAPAPRADAQPSAPEPARPTAAKTRPTAMRAEQAPPDVAPPAGGRGTADDRDPSRAAARREAGSGAAVGGVAAIAAAAAAAAGAGAGATRTESTAASSAPPSVPRPSTRQEASRAEAAELPASPRAPVEPGADTSQDAAADDPFRTPLSGPVSGPVRGSPFGPMLGGPLGGATVRPEGMRGGLGMPRAGRGDPAQAQAWPPALDPVFDTPAEFPLPPMPDPRPMPAGVGSAEVERRSRWTRRGIGIGAIALALVGGAIVVARMERAPDSAAGLMEPELPAGYGGDIDVTPRATDSARAATDSVPGAGVTPGEGSGGARRGGADGAVGGGSSNPGARTAAPAPSGARTSSSPPTTRGAAPSPATRPAARTAAPTTTTRGTAAAPSPAAARTPPPRSGATTSTAARTTAGRATPPAVAPARTWDERAEGFARCNSPALADQRACISAHLARSDAGLNQIYQDVIAAMRRRANTAPGDPDPPEVQRLRATQRAWIGRRDAECRRRGRGREGPLWATQRAQCIEDFSVARSKELSNTLARLRRD